MKFKSKQFRILLGAAGLVATATVGLTVGASADSKWPTESVEVVLHTKPGGGTDVFIRTLAEALEPAIGQKIVVRNAPGGAGATQMNKVRSSRPDGHTIGINTVTHFTGMLTNLKGTFAPEDFSWIALSQEDPILLFVRKDSEIASLQDLVERAKANSGTINIGGFGPIGSMQSVGISMLEKAAGVKFNWVAFQSTPDVVAALLGGHVDVGVSNLGPTLPFFEAGRVRGLGVLGKDRLSGLPDVPTFGEAGYKVDTSWVQVRGIFGPKNMSLELQQRIADAVHEAMRSEKYQAYARSAGVIDSWYGPKEYSAFVGNVIATAEEQLKAAGLVQ